MAIWLVAFTGVVRLAELVDVALEWMKEQIEKNKHIKEYVEGDSATKA